MTPLIEICRNSDPYQADVITGKYNEINLGEFLPHVYWTCSLLWCDLAIVLCPQFPSTSEGTWFCLQNLGTRDFLSFEFSVGWSTCLTLSLRGQQISKLSLSVSQMSSAVWRHRDSRIMNAVLHSKGKWLTLCKPWRPVRGYCSGHCGTSTWFPWHLFQNWSTNSSVYCVLATDGLCWRPLGRLASSWRELPHPRLCPLLIWRCKGLPLALIWYTLQGPACCSAPTGSMGPLLWLLCSLPAPSAPFSFLSSLGCVDLESTPPGISLSASWWTWPQKSLYLEYCYGITPWKCVSILCFISKFVCIYFTGEN